MRQNFLATRLDHVPLALDDVPMRTNPVAHALDDKATSADALPRGDAGAFDTNEDASVRDADPHRLDDVAM